MLSLNWIRQNLFSSWTNSIITVVLIYFLASIIPPMFDWLFFEATWVAEDRTGCTSDGACWAIIGARFYQFMYGFSKSSGEPDIKYTISGKNITEAKLINTTGYCLPVVSCVRLAQRENTIDTMITKTIATVT